MEIVIRNLSKKFKDNLVLDNVNLKFESGNIYGLVGENGSGKSVLLKLICSFYIPSNGEILIDNINYCDNSSFPNNLRAFIDEPSFYPEKTGLENLKELAKIQNKINEEKIIEALKIVNLYEEKDKKFYEYSMGMKQKLGIASVIMENPDIMIFDEPFNGVDEKSREKIIDYLKRIKNKKIIIVSSHVKEDINKLCDKIYCFEKGTIKLNEN